MSNVKKCFCLVSLPVMLYGYVFAYICSAPRVFRIQVVIICFTYIFEGILTHCKHANSDE